MPQKKALFRFVLVSDAHLNTNSDLERSHSKFEHWIGEVGRCGAVDALLTLGDMIQADTTQNRQRLEELLGSMDVPQILTVCGNHELQTAECDPEVAEFPLIAPLDYLAVDSFEIGPLTFFLIDNPLGD